MHATHLTTRRRFLRETFAFSAMALAGMRRQALASAPIEKSGQHLLMVGDWGATGSTAQQAQVAEAMQKFAAANQIKPDALLMLGDNFYGRLDGGMEDARWQNQFEKMYPAEAFPNPCYAVLGNHDYHVEPAGKADAQLAYAQKGGTRWTMPAKWYRFELPAANPLATFIALDSNYQKPTGDKQALTEAERTAQLAWLRAELAKPRKSPYLIVFGHHPLYSNGSHGDSKALAEAWDALFREHKAHLYLCGHDHDLQHLEFAGHPTSFVVSGGGGAGLTQMKIAETQRGPFGQRVAGFTHLQITPERLVIRHVDVSGNTLHAFSKTPDGKVGVV